MRRVGGWLAGLLHAVPAEEMGGIQLEGAYWEVAARGVGQEQFFRALVALVPEGSVLVLEGGAHSPELRELLREHAISPEVKVARGTVWPRRTVFHVPARAAVLDAVAELAERCTSPELCFHLHVYSGQTVLLQWYDAFLAPLFVSKRIAAQALEAFCRELNTSYKDSATAGA